MPILKKYVFLSLVLLGSMLTSTLAQAASKIYLDKLYIQSPAVYAPEVVMTPEIKAECMLDTHLSSETQRELGRFIKEVVPVVDLSGANQEMVLAITIVGVQGLGGGVWTGTKSMTIEAVLQQDGKVLERYRKSDTSMGGIFAAVKGTCSIFNRVVKGLSGDISGWLRDTLRKKMEAAAVKPPEESTSSPTDQK